MRFPGKKNLAFALILLIFSGTLPGFGAPLTAVNPVDRLNLNLTGDHGLYPALKGVTINPQNPFKMEFILDTPGNALPCKAEAATVIRYFLAALTLPEEELWVNLAPYEPERIITHDFSTTEMGEALLAQDYLLKQLSAALTFPETEAGKKYWDEINNSNRSLSEPRPSIRSANGRNTQGAARIETTQSFNKVWVTPKAALVREDGHSAYIESASLQALIEVDYEVRQNPERPPAPSLAKRGSDSVYAFKTYILPKVDEAVNHARAFAPLRQAYSAFIMATWFKQKLKQSIFTAYIDQKKITGINSVDKQSCEKIYQWYLTAFTQGAYNYVKYERVGANNHSPVQKIARRSYFSGGVALSSEGAVTFGPKLLGAVKPPGARAAVSFGTVAARGGVYQHAVGTYISEPDKDSRQAWFDLMPTTPVSDENFAGHVIKCKIMDDSKEAPLPAGVPSYNLHSSALLTIVLDRELKGRARREAIDYELCKHYIEISGIQQKAYGLALKFEMVRLVRDFLNDHPSIRLSSEYRRAVTDFMAKKIFDRDSADHGIDETTFHNEDFSCPELGKYVQEHLARLNEVREKLAPARAKRILHTWAFAYVAIKHMELKRPGVTETHEAEIKRCSLQQADYLFNEYRDMHDEFVLRFIRDSGIFEKPKMAYNLYERYNKVFSRRVALAMFDKTLSAAGLSNGNAYKRMGKDNRVKITQAFRRAYEAEIASHDKRTPEGRAWLEENSRPEIKGCYPHNAIIVDELAGCPIPKGVPSVSFYSSEIGKLIIVLRKDLSMEVFPGYAVSAREEAIEHERREDYFFMFLQEKIRESDIAPGEDRMEKILRIAHTLTTATMIFSHSKGKLLLLHGQDIAQMGKRYALKLIGENRSEQDGWIEYYLGPEVLAVVKDYDFKLVKPALRAGVGKAAGQEVGGIKISAQNIRVTGKGAALSLSPDILQKLQRACGMDFVIEAILPSR